MLPVDIEFGLLYLVYLLTIIFLIKGLVYSPDKKYFFWNTIVFACYFIVMVITFLDAENFKYGGSLVVLYYGWVLIILHAVVLGIRKVMKSIGER